MTTQKPKITRRGFRNAPADIRQQAEQHVAEFAAGEYHARYYADLGPSAYAWTLVLIGGTAHRSVFIYPSQDEER